MTRDKMEQSKNATNENIKLTNNCLDMATFAEQK